MHDLKKKKYLVGVFFLQCYIKKFKKKHLAIVTRRDYKSTETVFFIKRLYLY